MERRSKEKQILGGVIADWARAWTLIKDEGMKKKKKKEKMKEDVSEIGIQRLASNWIARHSSYPMRIYYSNQIVLRKLLVCQRRFFDNCQSFLFKPHLLSPAPLRFFTSSVPVNLMNEKTFTENGIAVFRVKGRLAI